MTDEYPWEKKYTAPEQPVQQPVQQVISAQVPLVKRGKHKFGHMITGEGHSVSLFDVCVVHGETFACEGGRQCLLTNRVPGLFWG